MRRRCPPDRPQRGDTGTASDQDQPLVMTVVGLGIPDEVPADRASDLELVAQAQDFEKLLKQAKDLDIEVYGEGMIPHIWSIGYKKLGDFRDVVNG